MSAKRDQIASLLGNGLSPETVASAVGCTPSYISQLLAEDEFRDLVTSRRVVAITARGDRDDKIDNIEDMLIEQLHDVVKAKAFYKPRDLLTAMSIINKAVRRGPQQSQVADQVRPVVNITLPVAIQQRFVMTPNNEVVAVGEQTLVTMQAGTLLNNLIDSADSAEQAGAYKEAKKFLVSSAPTFEKKRLDRDV